MQMIGPNGSGLYVFVPNETTQEWQYQETTQACRNSDLVFAYHHNHAMNNTWTIDDWWVNFSHNMIDAGASIYMSNGAQNIRGIEIYNGAIIAYSNGNLFFQGTSNSSLMDGEGYILDVCFDGTTTKFINARVIPTILQNGTGPKNTALWNVTAGVPTLSTGSIALQTLQTLQNLSQVFGTTITIDETLLIGYIQVSGFVPPNPSLKCLRTQDLNPPNGGHQLAAFGFWYWLVSIAVLLRVRL